MSTELQKTSEEAVASSELVVPRLIAKWRQQAKEARRDSFCGIDSASTRLATEARILERCARQLEQRMAWHNDQVSDRPR